MTTITIQNEHFYNQSNNVNKFKRTQIDHKNPMKLASFSQRTHCIKSKV